MDCGPRRVTGQVPANEPGECALAHWACSVYLAPRIPTDPKATTIATLKRAPNGTWEVIGVNCAATSAAPQVTPALALAQARRLVPHPKIGVAPPGGATLVNIQTLLWLDTPADQSLGTLTLLGHQVALRVHVDRVDWDFGDGHRDSTDGPQLAYNPADHCATVLCPGYWGHVYRSTGPATITSAVTWSGQYRVDGGDWQTIPDTVTGPPDSVTLAVKQARGILVPDPGGH